MFGLGLGLTILLILCILCVCAFEFINGFHDTANAAATVIYTKSLKPWRAVVFSGLRQKLAEKLQEQALPLNVDLELVPSAGSLESSELLKAGKIDFAMVQGALAIRPPSKIRQVAVLHVEPLHLLVDPQHHADVSINLRSLKGLTINVGAVGSGTDRLSTTLS